NGGAASTGWAADGPASATPRSYAWWSAACSKRPSRWACRPAPRSPPRIRRSTSSTWVFGTSPSAPTSPSCTSGGSPRVRTCARRSAADRHLARGSPVEKVVQQPIALPLHERREGPGLPSKPLFIEIEVLVRPFAIALHEPLDDRRGELQVEEQRVRVLVGEGLIPTYRGGRQERCAARQIEGITVPLKNAHILIESLEEGMGRALHG